MKNILTNKWFKASVIRAIKTIAQTAIATIGTAVVLSDVNWVAVLSASVLAGRLKQLSSVLGILEQDPATFLMSGANNDDAQEIEALIKERNDARLAKDWARADAARDKLKAMNIELEDGPNGTTWHRK